MTANRLRWGALAWLLTLQFFVVETIAQLRFSGGYSRTDDVISLLGASVSPAAQLMNASFVVQGALILGGALALRPMLAGTAGRAAVVLLGAAAAGVLLVGVFPLDGNGTAHAVGAGLYFSGGALGLIALAYAVRRRSEVVGTAVVVLGLIGAAGTIFFFAGITGYLGEGGTERAAGYVLPVALAGTGAALWRTGVDAAADAERERARAQARAQRAERDRERDEALAEAARRRERPTREAAADDRGQEVEEHWKRTSTGPDVTP